MKNPLPALARHGGAALALAAALALSTPAGAAATDASFGELVDQAALIPPGPHDSAMLAKVAEAVGFLKRMDLPHAQQAVNEALQLDDRNTWLHVLNGFVYHLQARQGDAQRTSLAIEGYQQALRLDPGNSIAQEFLGLAYMDMRQFDRARDAFAAALMLTPDSRTSLSGLMVSSYLTGDADTACAMADQFRRTAGPLPASFLRSSVAVYASCRDFTQADRMRQRLASADGDAPDVRQADRRLARWKAFYDRQAADGAAPQPASFSTDASGARPEMLAQAFPLPAPPHRPRRMLFFRPRAMDCIR